MAVLTRSQKSVLRNNDEVVDAAKKGAVKNDVKSPASHATTQYVVFCSLLLDLLAFTMILPLLPSLLQYYETHDGPGGLYSILQDKVKYFQNLIGAPTVINSVLFGGFVGSLYSFLQFLASPIIGALSDVYGRKVTLIICLCGLTLSYWLWAIADSFFMFIVARIVGGLSKGNISLSMAIMTDVSSKQSRTSGMALVGIAFSIGFVFGPMIGAAYAHYYRNTTDDWFVKPALAGLVLAFINVLFVATYFTESLPKEKRSKSVAKSLRQAIAYINITDLFQFTAVKGLLKKDVQDIRRIGLVYFLHMFIYSGLEFTLTFLTHYNFGYSTMQQGYMFFLIGITMALIQGGLVRRITPDYLFKYIQLGLILVVPSFFCIGLARNYFVLYVGILLYACSTSFVVPCMTTMASNYGTASQKGTLLGIFRSLGALARATGPVVTSIAYWSLGSRITYTCGGLLLLYPWYLFRSCRNAKN